VLGFGVCWRAANDGGGENCILEAGETAVLLSTGAHLGENPAFTGTLYFEMQGVEEFYGRVKDRVEMVWPLESMEYGTREFWVRHPNPIARILRDESRERPSPDSLFVSLGFSSCRNGTQHPKERRTLLGGWGV
jgi:hypothetical protein